MPVQGIIYELDGLRPCPVFVARYEKNWFQSALNAIRIRIESKSEMSCHYSLLAVRKDRLYILRSRIRKVEALLKKINGNATLVRRSKRLNQQRNINVCVNNTKEVKPRAIIANDATTRRLEILKAELKQLLRQRSKVCR